MSSFSVSDQSILVNSKYFLTCEMSINCWRMTKGKSRNQGLRCREFSVTVSQS
jgi:hypothetical protein